MKRQRALTYVISILHDKREELEDSHDHCQFECQSTILGALTKQAKACGLHPRPESPFKGLSVDDTIKNIQNLKFAKCFNPVTICNNPRPDLLLYVPYAVAGNASGGNINPREDIYEAVYWLMEINLSMEAPMLRPPKPAQA